jgi:hypothetical protein
MLLRMVSFSHRRNEREGLTFWSLLKGRRMDFSLSVGVRVS